MIRAFRVASFEWKKFFKDRWRLITFLFLLAFVLLAAFYFAFYWLGMKTGGPDFQNPSTQWDASLERQFEAQRDYWHTAYLIAIGEMDPSEGTITILYPADYCLKNMRYYQTMLDNRIPSCIAGFSSFSSPAFPLHSWYKEYVYLPAYRMMLFQDICFIFSLVPIWIHLYFTCRYDTSKRIDFLYPSVRISKKDLLVGRFIHCVTLFMATQCLFFLAGFFFYQDVPLLLYDGEIWHVIPCVLAYFQRWLEMGLASFALFFLLFVLGSVVASGKGYVVVGMIPTFGLMPLISILHDVLTSPQPFPEIGAVPFANLICSDGFRDGMGVLKYYCPLILIGVCTIIFLARLFQWDNGRAFFVKH